MIPAKVALLTNFIPPYRVALFKELKSSISEFQIYLSTMMESNRSWPSHGYDLKYRLQKTLTLKRKWKHPGGFKETIYVHVPYDTLGLLNNYQPDVVISSELGLRSFQAALYCKFHSRCRLILWCTLSEQTEQGRGWIREKMRHWLLPQADAVLTNGESGARYIKRFDVPNDSIFRIGQAPQIEDFLAVPHIKHTNEIIYMLAVGSLVERKGLVPFINILLRCLKIHPKTKIIFTCAGDGPLYSIIANQEFPLNFELIILGNVNYTDMPNIYADADILVFPTLADEWGLVVNEALAAGLPVLGSLYSQAVEEMVQNGENGWTFFPDRPTEMEHAINQALSTDRKRLAEMSVSARSHAPTVTPKTMSEKICQSLEYVLAKS